METVEEPDEVLMKRVAEGSRDALERLMRRHGGKVWTFGEWTCQDVAAGEELVQTVFTAVWMGRGKYEYPRPFKPWLYTIAANQCRKVWRGRKRSKAEVVDPAWFDQTAWKEGTTSGAAGLVWMVSRETAERVRDAVAALPVKQRVVVTLRIWQELSYAEIAEAVGCGEATARSHMHHGLASLRAALRPSDVGAAQGG